MSYGHNANYEIPQPAPMMNNISPQFYQQNMTQYPNCQQTYGNHNYMYPSNSYIQSPYGYYQSPNTYNYNAVVSSNSDANIHVNQNSKAKVEKRESKPLTVIDPKKMEAIDLSKLAKPKSNSLLDEIQHPDNSTNLIPDLPVSTIAHNVDQELKSEEIIEKVIEPIHSKEELNQEAKDDSCVKSALNCLSMRQSHSIPYKLDSLVEKTLVQQISSSSETDLHQKSPLSFNNLQEMFNSQRKIYNRDSLLKIGKSERSLKLPFSLDNCDLKEIISKEVNEVPKMLENKMASLMNWKSSSPKVITFGSPKSVSLSRITNGYLPPHCRINEECSMNKHLENCRRNLKCILNKIAPQNFDLCIVEIKAIIKGSDPQSVKIEDCIDCLIEEIFDKAVKEEAYSVTYANLCTKIAKFDDENEAKWNFKVSLLNRCKKMFETPLQDQLKAVKEHWDRKVEEEKDEKLKNLYRSDIEEQVKKARDKYFGNIRFIGELYLHDLLKPKIINSCVQTLLPKTNDEDAMLSLCKLIETCGKKFHAHYGDIMVDYIKSMNDITANETLETRIRFRVLDIIEMSERNWSLRTIQAQKMIRPKTLAEMKSDDTEDKLIAASKFPTTKSQNRSTNIKSMQNSNELKFKQHQNRNQQIELNSLSVGQNESFTLMPSYGRWAGNKEKDIAEWTNVDNKKGTRGKYPSSSSKSHQQMHGHNKSSPTRFRDDSPVKRYAESKFAILLREDDINDNRLPSPTIHLSSYETKSEDDIELIAREDLLSSLLQTKNLNVGAWCAQDNVDELITDWLDGIMEKDKAARNLVGDKLADLVACDKLSKANLVDGVTKFMELIEDLITDIPKIWLFLAEFLERFIQKDNSFGLFYKEIFENRSLDRNVSECIIMILKYASDRLGRGFLEDLVDSDLRALVDSIINQPDIAPYLQTHNLTFLIKPDDQPASSSLPSSVNKFSDSFKSELILSLPNDMENIYGLLESKFSLCEMQTDEFVYNTAYCIFSYICDLPTDKEVIDFIVDKQLFIIRLINNKPAFEAQILSALVHFAHRLEEKDRLLTVIDTIMRTKIISVDAFSHFTKTTEQSPSVLLCQTDTDQNYAALVTAIRSTLNNERR